MCFHSGADPNPIKPAPILSAIVLTSAKWVATSKQVSCTLSRRAPDSSNWPPGSKVIFAESLFKPIINLFSSIGFHPNVSIKPFKTLRTEQSPW